MLTKLVFEYKVLKTYFSRFLTSSAQQLFRKTPFDGCSWQYIGRKSKCPFLKNFDPPRKICLRNCLFPFCNTILSNNLLQTLYNIVVRRVTKEGGFYNKYLDWGCVNEWSWVDLENISSICNAKLNALMPLLIAGIEGLWTISFLLKRT